MDVRCEKCQTEYELDESRLKPGGVTVKCTNCGHMFKIRKRTPTNVGIPASDEGPTVRSPPRSRTESNKDGLPSSIADGGSGPTERNWLVRLENGEQKTCRELATLQQWIVAGVATRESLISRTGKTWKRLGDIAELRQYFDIADEARNKRAARPTPGGGASGPPSKPPPASSLDEIPTGRFASGAVQPSTAPSASPPPPVPTQPPPVKAAPPSQPKADPRAATEIQATPSQRPPLGRESVPWASSELKPTASIAAMPQGPSGGKFSAVKDEPAFAGRVRMDPGDDSSFDTNRMRADDDDALPPRARGSRAGTWIAIVSLLVIAGAAGAVYMFLFAKPGTPAATNDAGAVAVAAHDAGVGSASVKPIAVDAAVAAPVDPLDQMRAELASGVEPRLKGLYDSLADKTDGPSLAMRARLGAALAQSQLDRAALEADKGAGDKLRKGAKQLAIEVSALAQKALKAKADDPYANLAMADVLRVQGKTAHDVDRYLQIAKAKAGGDASIQRAVAVAAAQTDLRDNYFDDVHKDLGSFESADDASVRTVLALLAFAQNKPEDARPFVEKILAASPDHDVARALDKRLAVAVNTADPLPPEDHGTPGKHPAPGTPPGGTPAPNGANSSDLSGDYDALVRKADALAETNCAHATDIYDKALEQKPTGVEALTGIGYCNLNAKQFASAFSKFKTALAVSSRYEPALAGVAETYQQQGNKDQAIASWHAYLDAYPGAAKAKRQLEILGEGGDAGSTSTAQGSAAPAPAPTPAPTPAPAPAPAPAPEAPAPAPSGSAAG